MIPLQSSSSLLIAGILLVVLEGCNTSQSPAFTSRPEGNCTGRIITTEGTPVADASVFLLPVEYLPSPEKLLPLEFTNIASNDEGYFGIQVTTKGLYNIHATAENKAVLVSEVAITNESTVPIEDVVLRTPGTISGTIHLNGKTDHREAVLLLIGTNRYTVPSDTEGHYTFNSLAPAKYRLKALTTGSEYIAAETAVTVSSGTTTILPPIHLFTKSPPSIHSLTTTYDTLLSVATLSWEPPDTSCIIGYNIYLNLPEDLSPIAQLPASTASFSYDLLPAPCSTFSFVVTTFDKNNNESNPATAEMISRTDCLSLVNKQIFPPVSSDPTAQAIHYFDEIGNVIIKTSSQICKYDQIGMLQGSYTLPDTPRTDFSDAVKFDTAGNTYVQTYGYTSSIFTFDPQLNLIDTIIPLADVNNGINRGSVTFLTTKNGSIITFSRKYDDSDVYIHMYAPDGTRSHLKTIEGNLYPYDCQTWKDTIICIFKTTHDIQIHYYDLSMNLLKKFDTFTIPSSVSSSNYPFNKYIPSHVPFCITSDIFCFDMRMSKNNGTTSSVFFFFNGKGQLIGRMPFARPTTRAEMFYTSHYRDEGLISSYNGNYYSNGAFHLISGEHQVSSYSLKPLLASSASP